MSALSTVRIKAVILLCMLAGLSATTSAGEAAPHYRWLDQRGNPVHSDRPPPEGIEYQVVTPGSSIIRQVSGNAGAVPAETKPRVGNNFTQVDTKPDDNLKNEELCRRARQNLIDIDSAKEISIRDNQGNARTLSAEEIELERAKAQDAMAVHC
ncbi:MAG: DUF4124 domain-containing protein [Halioglobus sp.]